MLLFAVLNCASGLKDKLTKHSSATFAANFRHRRPHVLLKLHLRVRFAQK